MVSSSAHRAPAVRVHSPRRWAAIAVLAVAASLLSTSPAAGVELVGNEELAPAIRVIDEAEPPAVVPAAPEPSIVFAVGAPSVDGDELDGSPHAAEAQVAAFLETIGEVSVVPLEELRAEVVGAADVLVISAVTDSSDLKPFLLKANVPIVAMKPANWNALGLTPPNDDASTPLQSVRRISIESAHPIAANAGPAVELFADRNARPVGRGWSLPDAPDGADAPTVIATGGDGAALIAFDRGDALGWPYVDASDRAAACRVAFPAHGASDAELSDEGLSLLAAAVEWATGASCAIERTVPATPSADTTMCRTAPADEDRRAVDGELVERTAAEEPNLSSLWVRALLHAEIDLGDGPRPVVYVGGRFQTAHDGAAALDDDGALAEGGHLRMGVFACDLTDGTVTDFQVPIEIDSLTPVGDGVSNERVRALAFDGEWLYVGGKFTLAESVLADADLDGFRVEPTVSLLRVDPITGAIDTTWRPDLRGSVSALAIDGDWLYASGGLRQADGDPVTRLVRLDIGPDATGASDPRFRPVIEATTPVGGADPFASVLALEVVDETLFFGGSFQLVDGQARNSLAAIDVATGELTAFAPSLGDNNFGVDEIAQIKDVVADADGHVYACGDWWLTAETPGQTWVAYDVDAGAPDPNDPGWFGQRSRVQPRPNQFNVGKFDRFTGASVVDAEGVPWGPVTDGGVQACDYDPTTDTLLIGGHYERIGRFDQAFIDAGGPEDDDDYPVGHLAYEKVTAVDGSTGAILDWDPDLDSIRGVDSVRVIPVAGGGTEVLVGGAFTRSDRVPREGLARFGWR